MNFPHQNLDDACLARPAERRRAPERPQSPIPFRDDPHDRMPGPLGAQYESGPGRKAPPPPPTSENTATTTKRLVMRTLNGSTTSSKRRASASSFAQGEATNLPGEFEASGARGSRISARPRESSGIEPTAEAFAPMFGPALPLSPRRLQYEKRRALQKEMRENLARIIPEAMHHSEFGISKRKILEKRAQGMRHKLVELEPPASDRRKNAFARRQKADPMYLGASVEDAGIDPKYFDEIAVPLPVSLSALKQQDSAEWGAELDAAATQAESARDRDLARWARPKNDHVNGHNGVFHHNQFVVPNGARSLSAEDQAAAFAPNPEQEESRA